MIPSKNLAKESLVNHQARRSIRDPNTLFSKINAQRVQPINTAMPALQNCAENPEEDVSPEPRKGNKNEVKGEIISPERNPFKRNRHGLRPDPLADNENEGQTFSDSYKDPYRGLETANPLSKNDR